MGINDSQSLQGVRLQRHGHFPLAVPPLPRGGAAVEYNVPDIIA
jgi:hypothetical protein